MEKIISFLREARGELSKVAWPTRPDIIRLTVIVVAVSLATAFFLGGLDYVFSYILKTFVIR
jgi:preprotein translocase subunit SecE